MTGSGDNYASRAIAESARINRLTRAAEKTGRVIMVTGRGGTGKSTFTALASRFLKPPRLLCDIDPDQSLAAMLGIDLEKTQIQTEAGRNIPLKTLSELTRDIVDEDALLELGGGDLGVKLPSLFQWYTQYRSTDFDLISLGPRWTEGDYRAANLLFEFVIPAVGRNYAHIVIDSPAGLEHLNRRVVGRLDDLIIVVDPSAKSLAHIERVKKITRQVGMRYDHLYIIGNHEFDDKSSAVFNNIGEIFLGKMDFDPEVRDFNLTGRSLWELPETSPARVSVRDLLRKANLID
jgi:CO dehydrogenase maturation factor